MGLFAALNFGAPWILAALIGLPALWWLLKVTPPQPRRILFPPLRLLLSLKDEEQTPAHTPWWLMLLRVLAAGLLILALADPLLGRVTRITGSGPMMIVVDNGWTAARNWDQRQTLIADLLRAAGDRPVALIPTANPGTVSLLDAGAAEKNARELRPMSWPGDRAAAAAEITRARLSGRPEFFWLSDGIEDGQGRTLRQTLSGLGSLSIFAPDQSARGLLPPKRDATGFAVTAIRAGTANPASVTVVAIGSRGETLSDAALVFKAGEDRGTAHITVPLEVRNQTARLQIQGEDSAGGAQLLDSGGIERRVGLVSAAATENEQPLLSDVYYLERALAPFAEVEKGTISALIARHVSVLFLADVGRIGGSDADQVEKFLKQGGVLIRFAGPRMAGGADAFVPVSLRVGGRYLGSAMAWNQPQHLASFPLASPFNGLTIPNEVTVARQILAEPSAELSGRTWARLADGTPLVTARQDGAGWLVLFHITASPAWSSLPLSGLYVDMLKRLLALSAGTPAAALAKMSSLAPITMLDGFGRPQPPAPDILPIAASDFDHVNVSAKHPPGLYGAQGVASALNELDVNATLTPLNIFGMESYGAARTLALQPYLLALAALLLCIDALTALWLRGYFPRRMLGPAVAVLALLLAPVPRAEADEAMNLKAALDTRLAYVITGLPDVDEMSRAGLTGLGQAMKARTSYEPQDPMGADLARDDLSFYPLLYWPMDPREKNLSPAALSKLNDYMRLGGTILFDTRDLTLGAVRGATSPGEQTLRRLTQGLDLPPLEPVPADHVLTKAFYLLKDFSGRWAGGDVWVEKLPPAEKGRERVPARGGDGVSPVIIGGNDWAAAWAVDANGRPLTQPVPGGEIQREMALRFGINLVMYALTGNYKTDQVHAPALLERLGNERDARMTRLAFAPHIPLPLLGILIAIAAAITLFGLWRRARGALMRGVAFAILLFALAGPILVKETRTALPDMVALVVDRSQSMGVGKRSAQADAALAKLRQELRKQPNLTVRETSIATTTTGENNGTQAFAALNGALSDVPPSRIAGAIMITDGQVHDAPERLSLRTPLQVLVAGEHGERDRKLTVSNAERFAIVGQSAQMVLRVDDFGAGGMGGTAEVSVSVDGKPLGTKVVQVGQDASLKIPVTHEGENIVELAAAPGPSELTLQNNRAVVSISGVRDHLRVLLISGEPHAGERVWRNLLKSDPSVDLVHFTILRPPDKQDATPIEELSLIVFPTRELFLEKLKSFDLVIFDRYGEAGILPMAYFENIANYVEDGGALLVSSGPEFASEQSLYHTPLASVLPAQPSGEILTQGFKPMVTPTGLAHPVTRDLPGSNTESNSQPNWGRWFRLIGASNIAGQTVMSGPGNRPLLVLDQVKKGRVAELMSDQIWLWARGYEGGGPQAELLRRLAHWLMKEPELEAENLSASVVEGEMVVTRRTMAPTAQPVEMTMPSGRQIGIPLSRIEPGVWRGSMKVNELGLYRLADGTLSAVTAAGPLNPKEVADMRATADILEPLAKESGGSVHWLTDGMVGVRRVAPAQTAYGSNWIGLRRNGAYRVTSLEQEPLLPPWAALLLVVGSLVLAWRIEGR